MKYLSKWNITIYVISFVLTILNICSPTTCTTITRISQSTISSTSEKGEKMTTTTPLSTSNISSTSTVETSLATYSNPKVLTTTIKSTPETLMTSTSTDFLNDTSTKSSTIKLLSTSDYTSSPTPNVTKVSTVDLSSTISDSTITTSYQTAHSTTDHTTAVPTTTNYSSTVGETALSSTNHTTAVPTTTNYSSTVGETTLSSTDHTTAVPTTTNYSSTVGETALSSTDHTTAVPALNGTTYPTTDSTKYSTTYHATMPTTVITKLTLSSTTDNATNSTSYSTAVSAFNTSANTQSSTTDKTTESTSYGMAVSTSGITTHTSYSTTDNTTESTLHSSTVSTLIATTTTSYASTGTTSESTLYNTTVSTLGIITTNHSTAGSTSYSTMASKSDITTDTTTLETAITMGPTLVETTDTFFSTTNSTSYNGMASTPGIPTHIITPTTPIPTTYNKPTSATDTTFPTTVSATNTTSYSISVSISNNITVKTTTPTTTVSYPSSTTPQPASTTTAKEIDCGPVPNIFNGVIISDNTRYGSFANVTCYSGYNTSVPVIQCTAAGIWEDSSCTIDCGRVPIISNGVTNLTVTTYGWSANVTCKTGYNTSKPVIQCTAAGVWENSTCTIIDCGRVPTIFNGVTNSTDTTYGSSANVTCNTGYNTSKQEIQCTAAGIWENSTCTIIDIDECASSPCLNGATCIDRVNGFTCNCNPGYTGTICSIDIDECELNPCQNGANCINMISSFTCNCSSGYTDKTCSTDIDECASNPCQNRGTCFDMISGFRCNCNPGYTDTTCAAIDCGRVPIISNGAIISDNTTYGSLANVTCNTGYNTSKPIIQCLATGIWENSACTAKDCGKITEAVPKNGMLETPATTTYGSRFVYSCNEGYRNVGNSIKECLANGSWSSTAPNCIIKDCGVVIGTIQNGQMINPTNTTTYGSELMFKCDGGYTLVGVSSIQCSKLGLWSGLKPTCHKDAPRTCKTENDSRGTVWTESPIHTTALQRCAEGFEGNITRQCSVDGIWQFPLYSCLRISVKDIDNKVANLTTNASAETVNTALDAITTETTRSQNSTADQKLTDGELTLLSTALEKVASVLSPSVVKNENITNSFIESASNLIDSTNKDSWKALSSTNKGAEKVLSAVSSMGEALAESLKDGGNKTTIIKNNIAMEVKKFDDEVLFPDPHTNASDKETQWITESKSSIRLDSDALSGSGSNVTYITTAVMYRDMSEILPSKRSSVNGSDEATEEKEKINGPILALSIIPTYNGTLNPPVTITFKHQLTNYTSPLCSYWSSQNDSQGWSSSGCKVNSTNDSFTVCTCNHLTNFAILMSPFREADTSSKALRTISIVGISVSIVCLIAVFVLHFALWRYLRNDRTTVLMNLCVALLLSYIIFLAGVDRTESNVACTIIAAILHYIYLVVFCVMLVEGILIATIVHFVFNSKFRVKILLVIAWVLPAVIVGISLGVSKTLGYGNNSVCWLSTDKGLIWAFVGPALIIITFNVVCILIVIRAIFSTKAMETKKASEKVKTSLRSLAVLVPLMGVSWIVGIFYVDESLDFIQYIFAILNGLQGFFIFLFHCPLNDQVKKGLRLWRRRTSWTWLRTTSGTTSSKYKDSNELRETDRSYVDSVDYTSRSNNDWREKALDYNLPTLPSTSWLNRSKDSASRLSSHAYNTISDDWTSPRPFSSQI